MASESKTVEPADVPKYKSRIIKDIRYTEKQLGETTINKILNLYNSGLKMSIIIRKINPSRNEDNALSLLDLYAIFSEAIRNGRIKQRHRPKEEFTVTQFQTVFGLWKQGHSAEYIRNKIIDEFVFSRNFFNSVMTSLNNRYRYQTGELERGSAKKEYPSSDSILAGILKTGERTITTDGTTPLIVILVDKVPTELIITLREIDPELAGRFFPQPISVTPLTPCPECEADQQPTQYTVTEFSSALPDGECIGCEELKSMPPSSEDLNDEEADDPWPDVTRPPDSKDQDDDFDPADFIETEDDDEQEKEEDGSESEIA